MSAWAVENFSWRFSLFSDIVGKTNRQIDHYLQPYSDIHSEAWQIQGSYNSLII